MKKIIALVIAFLLVGVINVNAATESELRAKLVQDYTVNGKTVSGKAYAGDIDRYLAKYELSSEDCDFIIAKIDEIVALAQADGAKTFTDLSSSSKSKAVSIVAEISNKTSVKATLTTNGVLTIFENDGKTVFVKIVDADKPRQTGSNYIILGAALVISILGAAYVVKRVVKTNA